MHTHAQTLKIKILFSRILEQVDGFVVFETHVDNIWYTVLVIIFCVLRTRLRQRCG